MTRRRLTQNQTRRIQHRQSQQVAATDPGDDAPLDQQLPGVVISRFGKQVDVEDPREPGLIERCHIRANIDSLVAGDRVVWCKGQPEGVVLARLERSSAISRPEPNGRPRMLAANLDQIIVVLAPEPAPHANLLDRYLVAARDARIEAIILLNKMDMGDSAHAITAMLAEHLAIGYRLLHASALQNGGLDELRAALVGHTTAFVGQSGVGKSSLIAALLPAESIRIGNLSDAESKGRHTTTTARLFHLPGGGDLIDSPGIREFSLEHIDAQQTAMGFVEFEPYLGRCRFRDCKHGDEPGCLVRDAVERGAISVTRYSSYLQIMQAYKTETS